MRGTLDVAKREIPDFIDVSRTTKSGMTITCDISRVIKILVSIVITLAFVGTIADIIKFQVAPSTTHRLARLMNRFVLGFEPSIPNWYSSTALFCSGILLAVIAIGKWQAKDRFSKHWTFMALLFPVLSIDEGVRLHEMIHTVMIKVVETSGIFYFPSVIPMSLFVAVFGLVYIPFLRHIDRRTAILFVLAGGVYVFGTIGMDMVGGLILENYGEASIQHTFTQLIEESCEMLGIVIFLYALLDYIRRSIGSVHVRLA